MKGADVKLNNGNPIPGYPWGGRREIKDVVLDMRRKRKGINQ